MALLEHLSRTLLARPLVYDTVQTLAGSRRCYARLRHRLPDTSGLRVLDVGGGTGLGLSVLNPTARYLCLDPDLAKLSRLRSKHPGARVVGAGAQALPARTSGFDVALCVFVCHHLEDGVLRKALREVARVCRGSTFIMEPLWVPGRRLSSIMWRYDQDAYPRSRKTLLQEIEASYKVEFVEEFSVLHRYVLCQCRPL